MNKGKIVQVLSSIVDVEFKEKLPAINNALKINVDAKNNDGIAINLTLEVALHLGNSIVRCISMGSTDGLRRGMEVVDTNNAITVPVGECTLGRVFNVLGEPIDGKEAVKAEKTMPIHRPAPLLKYRPSCHFLTTFFKRLNLNLR